MVCTLILIRHAKSDWSTAGVEDHDRPLNARGLANAPRLGQELARRGLAPDQVLCSTALRTRQTWDLIAAELDPCAAPDYRPDLYHATPEAMLEILQGATGKVVAVIAHNPGIGALANALVSIKPAHPRFGDYPTGATLIAEHDGWASLQPGTARLRDFFYPRDFD